MRSFDQFFLIFYGIIVLLVFAYIGFELIQQNKRAVVYKPYPRERIRYPFWKFCYDTGTVIKHKGRYFQLKRHYGGYGDTWRSWSLISEDDFAQYVFERELD